MPWSNDALHMRAITGASTFMISHVETGSRLQCFVGAFLRRSVTSSTVSGSNATSGSCTERWEILGGRALAIDDRMFSIVFAKNISNLSAEWFATGFDSGCTSGRSFIHIDLSAWVDEVLSTLISHVAITRVDGRYPEIPKLRIRQIWL